MNDDDRKGTWSISDSATDGNGLLLDAWHFHCGERWDGAQPLDYKLVTNGTPLEFDLVGLEVPLVARTLLDAVSFLLPEEQYQAIPSRVLSRGRRLEYATLNILAFPDCLDLSRSQYTPWEEGEFEPWRNPIGHLFVRPAIQLRKVEGLNIFRLRNWGSNRLIVSEKFRQTVLKAEVKHLLFNSVITIKD